MLKSFMISALLVFASIGGTVFAQDDLVVEGTGQGIDRQEATLAAKRDAIEKGIGTVLLSQTEIQNFMVQRDQIITKTMGVVKAFDIISENRIDGKAFEIKIKATISKTALHQDLAAFHVLIESMNKPRVMVVIQETNLGSEEPVNHSAENAVIAFLKTPYEFEVVDPAISASIKSSQQKMAALAGGDAAAAAAVASQYGAEVLISGTAISSEAKGISANLGGMVSVQADVTLKAINCSNAHLIGTGTGHGANVHISPASAGNAAIEKGANKAIKGLLDNIIQDWQNQANNGMSLSISFVNVGSFRVKNAIIQTVQGMAGVSVVRERSWDDQSKLLTINIQYKGTINGFCTKLDGYKLKSGSGSIAISSVNGMNVAAKLEAM